MIQVNFQNMDRSELAREATSERLETVIERFPDLRGSIIKVYLEMLNSPIHAGPDLFSVTVQISSGRYSGVRMSKSAPNLYMALAEVVDRMLEKLNRFGDRTRVKSRAQGRDFVTKIEHAKLAYTTDSDEWEGFEDQEVLVHKN